MPNLNIDYKGVTAQSESAERPFVRSQFFRHLIPPPLPIDVILRRSVGRLKSYVPPFIGVKIVIAITVRSRGKRRGGGRGREGEGGRRRGGGRRTNAEGGVNGV